MENLSFVLCVVVSFFCSHQTEPGAESENDAMISVSMYSSTVKDTMVIDVSFPGSYKADLTTRYPVLYLTDGYWRRGQHGPIHSMAKTENVREMIIVGIGYPSSHDPNSIRVRDLIRNPDRFLDFILHELIPYVDKEFRTTNEQTLWGSSYGGFFAMFTLFRYAEKTKGAFQNYVVVSPAALETAYYDGSETNLFDFERMLSAKTTDLNLGLYVTVGGNEDPDRFLNPFRQLVSALESRHYNGFFMKSFIDPGKDHYTVWEPTLYEGVRMFLKK